MVSSRKDDAKRASHEVSVPHHNRFDLSKAVLSGDQLA